MHSEGTMDTRNYNTNADEIPQNSQVKLNECLEKQSAVWTTNATQTLLKLYENKLEMLETPKKKTRIWAAISDNLRDYNIEVTPDQVRWKINALTKKYKQCVHSGRHEKFRYFKEMDNIYAQYHVDCDSYTMFESSHGKKNNHKLNSVNDIAMKSGESKAMIELRKIRLANRIESDRTQSKLQLEKQWLEYLKRHEIQMQWRDEIFEKNLNLKKEELELRKRELQLKETLECKKIQLMEKDHNDMLRIEREKCELLSQIFCNKL